MAKHLTTDEQRGYLLKTISEARLQAAHLHLESCADCRVALEAERKRLAVLDGLRVEKAPSGLAERTLEALALDQKPLSRGIRLSGPRFAFVAASILVVIGIGSLYRAFVREELNHGTQLTMRQLGMSFKMAANESDDGSWPALDPRRAGWTPELGVLSKDIQSHPYILVSKNHPDFQELEGEVIRALQSPSPDLDEAASIMSESFAYLGYTMEDEAEFEAIRQAKEAKALPVDDASLPSSMAGTDVHPLREGVERFLITDINNPAASARAQSTTPVLLEIATWKYKESVEDFEGTYVLYMDGHVEFVSLGEFPVLPQILDALTGG